jgi:phage N-6-adenine-methyltransferase
MIEFTGPTHMSVRSGGRENDDWITPREVIEALGPFDLDPCASAKQPWPTAARLIAPPDDGLAAEWSGAVWLNPPYSHIAPWVARLAAHGHGIALIPASVETKWFSEGAWAKASAVMFLRGRLNFCRPDGSRSSGNIGRGLALVAYGPDMALRLKNTKGALVTGWVLT